MLLRRLPLRAASILATALLVTACGWFAPPLDEVADAIARCPAYDARRPGVQAPHTPMAQAATPAWTDDDVVADRLIVRYQQDAHAGSDGPRTTAGRPGRGPRDPEGRAPQLPASARAVRAAHGLRPLRALMDDMELVDVDGDMARTMARLRADPRVLDVQPDVRLRTQAVAEPNDPYYPQQWSLSEFGVAPAWSHERGSASVTLAIVDTGVALDHEDLAGRFLPGWDFAARDDDPGDPHQAHGTHVTGIAAALTDNGLGMAGVAREGVRILPVKVTDANGGTSASLLIEAITWASGGSVAGVPDNPHPAQVINVSLGGPGPLTALATAVERAAERGALVVAAVGNDTSYPSVEGVLAPASAPCALGVGSVDADGTISGFSRYQEDERLVDIAAPGGHGPCPEGAAGILSTVPDGYRCMQGTSMAAPFVAGALALLRSQDPDAAPEELLARLLRSARFDTASMSPQAYGFGVACVDAALGADTACGP